MSSFLNSHVTVGVYAVGISHFHPIVVLDPFYSYIFHSSDLHEMILTFVAESSFFPGHGCVKKDMKVENFEAL